MKVNIKDDQSGRKRDSEKLATIKKSEKPGDSKISAAKKTAISEVIVNITNQTPVPAQSTSIENIIHFTNPEKAFTPLASTFTGVAFSKDLALLGNSSKYCQPSVFEQSSIPRSLPNDLSSNTMNSSQFESVVQSVEENIATLSDSLSKQQSSTVKPTMQSSLTVSNVIKSSQTVTDESMKETTIDLNDSLSNIQSSTPARLLMHNSLVDPCMVDSPQITTIEPEKENTTTLNDSLSNLSSTTVTPLIQNSLVSDTINSQSTPDVQPMEENSTFDDFLQVQEPLNSMKSPMQNNSCNNVVDLKKFESTAQTVEKNTTQVLTVPLAESKSKEVNSNKLSNIKRASNSLLTPVQNSPSNTQKACNALKRLQCSMSAQTEASDNNTSSVSKSDKKTLPSQNPPTKGVKRKAEEIESTVKVQNSPSNIQKVQKVQNSPSNIQKACNALKRLQCSMSAQTQASNNTTSSVSKSNKKTLPSQNPPTKGVKRKAEKIENTVKNSGNSGKKKNNKKKQKFIPQIFKKKRNMSQNNFPPMTNYKSLMCAIVEEQYPNMPPLTNVHLGTIRNVIKEKIDNLPFGVFVPKFMNAFIKDGVILVECADSNSKEWLKSAITNYNPAEGIYLKVIPPETINQYYPASIFVQDEENAIDVLKRMQKQNPDISIRNWQYLSMIIVKESTPGITINVGIPATSVAQLKEKHFKLFHAVSQVTVVMKVKVPF